MDTDCSSSFQHFTALDLTTLANLDLAALEGTDMDTERGGSSAFDAFATAVLTGVDPTVAFPALGR
jgi:hypothetical protein